MFDGNWVDMTTVGFGIAAIFAKPTLRKLGKCGPCWVHREAANDFLNGAALAPFVLLLATPFSNWLLSEMVNVSKVSLGLAGGIGVMYVTKEVFSYRSPTGSADL